MSTYSIRNNVTLLLIAIVSITMGSCGSFDSDLRIRIRNDTGGDFSNLWLGAGVNGGATRNTSYGSIDDGETTRYRGVESVIANYRKANGVIDGERYFHAADPDSDLGRTLLQPGKYTFTYSRLGFGTDLGLEVTRDGD